VSINLVREFHVRFGQPVNDEPTLDDGETNRLRIALLSEELTEFAVALADRDPVAVLDALTDLQYVLDGAYLSLGFHRYKDAALNLVHRSNMSKLGADGKPVLRDDGKVTKGPSYEPPDLRAVLRRGASTQ
jgi:predicted HAD superfamily Cof-like phosphohydrolase